MLLKILDLRGAGKMEAFSNLARYWSSTHKVPCASQDFQPRGHCNQFLSYDRRAHSFDGFDWSTGPVNCIDVNMRNTARL
jgi:hypothetical protein